MVSGGVIKWVDCCFSICTFKCNLDNAKSCFFKAFTALQSRVDQLTSEQVVLSEVALSLICAKCLPIRD